MPDTTPTSPKAARCPLCARIVNSSFCARAAAFLLAVSLCAALALYLAATLPDKFSGWQTALPRAGMNATDAEGAYLRAQYLHEAQVRPRLIRAGLLSPEDAVEESERNRYGRDKPAVSDLLVKTLWTMRAFPEIHDALLGLLADGNRPPEERIDEFFHYAAFLAATADSLARNNRSSRLRDYFDHRYGRQHSGLMDPDRLHGLFDYYNNDPRQGIIFDHGRVYPKDTGRTPAAGALTEYSDKLDLARRVLPLILDDARAVNASLAEEKSAGKKARNDRKELADQLEDLGDSVNEAVRVLWEERANPGFFILARNLLLSGQGTVEERYDSIPLMVEKPGLPVSEYVFWQKYRQDLASVTSCVGTAPRHYGFILGCMGDLMPATTSLLKAQGTFILGGQTGPGISMTRTDAFAPARNLSGKLYLLADMGLAMKDAPEYDLSRAFPIFRGMLYRYMVNQPLVLPLNPQNPKDAAVIKWYAEKGWEKGRTLLFSAVGSPEEVARHWGTVHLVWWPDKKNPDGEPDLAYFHPVSGHFMTGVLPQLKGAAVTRFLGPVTGLWFGRWNVEKTGWVAERYEARPEEAPRPMAASAARTAAPPRSPLLAWLSGEETKKPAAVPARPAGPPTILLGKDLLQKSGSVYRYNYRVTLARSLDTEFHDPDSSPVDVFSFVDNAVTMMNEWKINRDEHVRPATTYLWRFRADPAVEKRIYEILSQKELSAYDRLRKVRRVLGLSEITKDQGC